MFILVLEESKLEESQKVILNVDEAKTDKTLIQQTKHRNNKPNLALAASSASIDNRSNNREQKKVAALQLDDGSTKGVESIESLEQQTHQQIKIVETKT